MIPGPDTLVKFIQQNAGLWAPILSTVIVTAVAVFGALYWWVRQQREFLKQQQKISDKQLAASDEKWNASVLQLKVDHAQELNDLKASVSQTKLDHAQELNDLKASVSQLKLDHDRELNELKTVFSAKEEEWLRRNSSIERRLGGQTFFDVAKLFGSMLPSIRERVGIDIRFFPNGGFYALDNAKKWDYETSPAYVLIDEIRGKGPARALPAHVRNAMDQSPWFIWKGKERHSVGGGELKWLFPHITVEILPFDRLAQRFSAIKNTISEFDEDIKLIGQANDDDMTSDIDAVSWLVQSDVAELTVPDSIKTEDDYIAKFRSEAVGYLFTHYLNLISVASADKNVRFSLRKVQKAGPVLYAQSVLTLSDLKIDEQIREKYYLSKEIFATSTQDRMVVIQTTGLSETPDLTDPCFEDITFWLDGFCLQSSW